MLSFDISFAKPEHSLWNYWYLIWNFDGDNICKNLGPFSHCKKAENFRQLGRQKYTVT